MTFNTDDVHSQKSVVLQPKLQVIFNIFSGKTSFEGDIRHVQSWKSIVLQVIFNMVSWKLVLF